MDKVAWDDEGLRRSWGLLGRKSESALWSDVVKIEGLVTLDGPGDDIVLLVHKAEGGVAVKSETPGFMDLITDLSRRFESFDLEGFIGLMGSPPPTRVLMWSAPSV